MMNLDILLILVMYQSNQYNFYIFYQTFAPVFDSPNILFDLVNGHNSIGTSFDLRLAGKRSLCLLLFFLTFNKLIHYVHGSIFRRISYCCFFTHFECFFLIIHYFFPSIFCSIYIFFKIIECLLLSFAFIQLYVHFL